MIGDERVHRFKVQIQLCTCLFQHLQHIQYFGMRAQRRTQDDLIPPRGVVDTIRIRGEPSLAGSDLHVALGFGSGHLGTKLCRGGGTRSGGIGRCGGCTLLMR